MTTAAAALDAAKRALAPVRSGIPVDDEHELAARIVWSHLVEPGDGIAGRLIAELGAAAALEAIATDRPSGTPELTSKELEDGHKRWMPRLAAAPIRVALEVAARAQVRLVVPGDGEWPTQVADLGPHAPVALWVRGDRAALARLRPSVAIVGARAATSYGEHVAMEFAADLAGSGIPVVSGAAYGIDGSAHRAALATGGLTVALVAGGVERPYPAGHSQLLNRIASAGAAVSEVPCGSAPTKWRFLQRNRLIAALSDVTVVVEAGWRSGSLNTAAHALEMGRAVAAVPGPVTSAASAGAHRLLRDGAVCVTNADDVRELLGRRSGDGHLFDLRDDRPPTDDRTRVRDALSARAWRDVEELARRSGMSAADVEGILGLLQLNGEVESGYLGWRRSTLPA
ncbi:DNA-protecting protein DprA [Microbacterium sp. 4R-513]|uniref:DNA-processing protein DprA n=1 Tax=Microbacterium sp. 4R-513 TaxID=2567934 RepID=UPI0013E1DFDE|nr:DNA-processing protein DprA [Microbacterium sp. 4R-513]QIG40488.1 DNA-protecting protein DprA [Microbacterium sp. 4R-513]